MASGASAGPDRRRWRRTAVALGAVGLLLLVTSFWVPVSGTRQVAVERVLATGGPGGGGNSGVLNVSMNTTDAPAFVPSVIESAPAELVQLKITNVGAYSHTFTLSQTANTSVARNVTPTQLYAFFNRVGTMANLSLAPGATAWANLTMPSANLRQGFFFASVVPFQFQAGMSGWLNVTPRPTGAPTVLTVATAGVGFSFQPNVLAVSNASFPVAVAVQVGNLGTQLHTWTLSAFPNYNMSTANFSDFLAAHPPLANAQVPTAPGQVVWANFTITQKGVYQFICTLPGHFANGMYGYLYVGVSPPPVVQPPSNEIVQMWVLIGGAVILGVGVVIAVVASLSGRMGQGPSGYSKH